MIERYVEEVQSRIRKSALDLQHQLGHNQCGDWGGYQNKVGVITGLEIAAGIVAQVLTVFHEEEDAA